MKFRILLPFSSLFFTAALAQATSGPLNLPNDAPNQLSIDAFTPVERGYIEPTIEEIAPGKYRINVEANYGGPDTKMRLHLQAVTNDGYGTRHLVILKELQPPKMANKASLAYRQRYRSHHSFIVTADELNKTLAKAFPNSPGLRISSGTQLFVHGQFTGRNPDAQQRAWGMNIATHNWGSVDRGGGITIPGTPKPVDPNIPVQRPTALDITFPQGQLAATALGNGLDPKGHIGSRIEMEGKWAMKGEAEFNQAQDRLLALVKDPDMKDAAGNRILPPGWTISLEDRYILRDAAKVAPDNPHGYVLDARGVPVADPMRDIASDSKDLRLAKTDTVLRARHTHQNNTTVINYKSGGAGYVVDADGVVFRPEYQVAVQGGDPANANTFFRSEHPLNFMKGALAQIGINDPAEATVIKTAEQNANRLKFKLSGPNQLEIEVSTDHVKAKSLIDPKLPPIEFFQIEADAAHLAVRTSATPSGAGLAAYNLGLSAMNEGIDITKITYDKETQERLARGAPVTDAKGYNYIYKDDGSIYYKPSDYSEKAFFDGRPVLHSIEDLDPNSPMMKTNAADFAEFKKAMIAIRDHAIGANDWVPAANKLAYSNVMLGHVTEAEASASVKAQLAAARAKGWLGAGPLVQPVVCPTAWAALGK